FSRIDNASKVALLALCRTLCGWDFPWLDAQVPNPHLSRMGALTLPRPDFLRRWHALVERRGPERWHVPFARACDLA
ncbi:MAG: hypothetical protein JSS21_09440, partial [Proteobacteria bacterium]|nr:hypothetical protein [Pseudomonadota bacterium]